MSAAGGAPGISGDEARSETEAVARRLLNDAGLPPPAALSRLAGGKNNRVFRLDLEDGAPFVLKLYHRDPRDPRDRLGAEWRFLSHAWARGVTAVPEPIRADPAAGAGLYGFVEGRRIDPAEIDGATVDAAAAFVVAVNAPPAPAEPLPPGSEACFSLADHCATVGRRVARLAAIDHEAPLAAEAEAFVGERLAPAWALVEARIAEAARGDGLDMDRPIERAILSPSDFGFHNTLRGPTGRDVYIDFEYAGLDDPAKLVCDFFCQPEVPVPAAHFERFADALADGLALSRADRRRPALLLDAYRVKWVCIILNEFLAVGASRRAFADPGARAERCARQLARAARGLAFVAA